MELFELLSVEGNDSAVIPKYYFNFYSFELIFRSRAKIYKPSIILLQPAKDSIHFMPEWLNYRYKEGWVRRDHGFPPSPSWWLYYYKLGNTLYAGKIIRRKIKFIIKPTAQPGNYIHLISLGGYTSLRCSKKDWSKDGWIQFTTALSKPSDKN